MVLLDNKARDLVQVEVMVLLDNIADEVFMQVEVVVFDNTELRRSLYCTGRGLDVLVICTGEECESLEDPSRTLRDPVSLLSSFF